MACFARSSNRYNFFKSNQSYCQDGLILTNQNQEQLGPRYDGPLLPLKYLCFFQNTEQNSKMLVFDPPEPVQILIALVREADSGARAFYSGRRVACITDDCAFVS